MELILAAIPVLLGWVITHRLTLRAQEKAFLNQVMNQARVEIVPALRGYQSWLIDLGGMVAYLERGITPEKLAELRDLLHSNDANLNWILTLEEYEALFPKTRDCRHELLAVQRTISSQFFQLTTLHEHAPPERTKILEQVRAHDAVRLDQIALIEDLRIYVQNTCLSRISGHAVPPRQATDANVPRLVADGQGMLHISPPRLLPTAPGDAPPASA